MVRVTHYKIVKKDMANTCLENNDVDILLSEKELNNYKKSLKEKYQEDVCVHLIYTETEKNVDKG